VDNDEQVLNHFLFRTQRFLIQYQQRTVMRGAQMGEQFIPEPGQPILVCNNQPFLFWAAMRTL
jgi:hypothetical protein